MPVTTPSRSTALQDLGSRQTTAVAVEQQLAPIPQELLRCENGLREIHERISRLEDALNSVLGPHPADDAKVACEPPLPNGIQGRLIKLGNDTANAINRVESLQGRLLI